MKPVSIKPRLIVCFLLFFSVFSAQQTLYYPNGQKAIEGNWRISSFAVMPNSYLDFLNQENYHSERNRKIMNIPEYPGYYWEYNETLLRMQCEGPVSLWYPTGTRMAEINFTNGIISGNYIGYHENGRKAMEGLMQDGMPNGPWMTYYKSGQVFFSGTFIAHSQEDLLKRFSAGYALKTNRFALRETVEYVSEEFDTLRNEMAMATVALRWLFTEAIPQTASAKNGKFIVYRNNGQKWAEMEFVKNVRHGKWTLFENNLPKHELEYNFGHLLSVKEENHNKETVKKYSERWAGEEKKRQLASANNKEVGGIPEPYESLTWMDEAPRFEQNLQEYILKNIHFNYDLKVNDVAGEYIATFHVEETGKVTRVRIEQGRNIALNKEFIRVIESMPLWKPGTHNNVPVSMPSRARLNFGITANY